MWGVSSSNAQLSREWKTIDSLKQALRQAPHDSAKARLCDDLSFEFYSVHIDSVLFYANLSQQYARQSDNLPLLAQSYNSQGIVYFSKAEFIDALSAFQEANRIYADLNDRGNVAKMINNLGLILSQMRDFNRANDRLEESYSMGKELGEWYLASHALYNIAGNYFEMGDIPAAWEHARELEGLRREHPMEATSADALFGDLFNHENQLDSAIHRYLSAVAFYETQHDLFQSSATRTSLAEALIKANRTSEAWTQTAIAQKIIEENAFTDLHIQLYQVQASLHHANGQEKLAFELERKAFNLADSLQKHQQIGIVNDMNSQFESSQINQELERKNLQLQNRTIWIISVIGFALFCAGTALLLFRLSRRTGRLNTLLRQKNSEIANQRQSIISSINYAKRIQESVHTRPEVLEQSFAKSVFVNRPRDIISGDFFTYQYVNNRHYLAVVDCTGHGVPGAFISVIVNARLRKVLHELKERDPARIIDRLNEEILLALHQEAGDLSSMDGVEISVCSIHVEKNIIEYSGAGAPMLLIQPGSDSWKEMKGYSSPLGGP
ncbi:MAG: SpoIIE family protein phosphatase, partial [Flavobacteriales bacterium]